MLYPECIIALMSPSVERTEFKGSDSSGQTESFITIGLSDPEAFDPKKFDKLVQDSIKPEFGSYPLKYIVCGDTMYLFPDNLYHDDAESLLRAGGVTGSLQSAGRVVLILGRPGSFRTIDDHSNTLEDMEILSKHESDVYKTTVIRAKLGDSCDVTQ